MKRRIASYAVDGPALAGKDSLRPAEPSVLQRKKTRLESDHQISNKDIFSVTKWIRVAPRKNNSLSDVVKNHPQGEKVRSEASKSIEKGIPYGFAARKEGQRLFIIADSESVAKDFIDSEKHWPYGEKIYFGAFVEQETVPLVFGTYKTIKKTGANSLFLEYLLEPQNIEEENIQLQSRALFQALLDAADMSNFSRFSAANCVNTPRRAMFFMLETSL